jgi:predicted nuclease of predicted toxin-antitoxin system
LVWGAPPQVIWLKTQNLNRAATLKILLENKLQIQESLLTHSMACIELS